jgi:hypothetical protein
MAIDKKQLLDSDQLPQLAETEEFDPAKYFWFPGEEPHQLSAQKLTKRRLLHIIEHGTNAELDQFLTGLKDNVLEIVDSVIYLGTLYFTTPLFHAITTGDPEKLRTILKYNPNICLFIKIFNGTNWLAIKLNPLLLVINAFGVTQPEKCLELMGILLEKDSSLITFAQSMLPLAHAILRAADPLVVKFLFSKTETIPNHFYQTVALSVCMTLTDLLPGLSRPRLLNQQPNSGNDKQRMLANRQENFFFLITQLPLSMQQKIATHHPRPEITLLTLVAIEFKVEVTKAMLDAGANPNTINNQGDTILHSLTAPHNIQAVKDLAKKLDLFAQYGASFTVRNNNGDTPFTMACAELVKKKTSTKQCAELVKKSNISAQEIQNLEKRKTENIAIMRPIIDKLISYTAGQTTAQQQFEQPNVKGQLPVEMLAVCEEWELLQKYIDNPNFPPIDPTRPITTAQYEFLAGDTTLTELLQQNGQVEILAKIIMHAQECGLASMFVDKSVIGIFLLNSISDYKLTHPKNEDVVNAFCNGLSYLEQVSATDPQYKKVQYTIGHALMFLVDYPEEVQQKIVPLLGEHVGIHQPKLLANQIRLAANRHLALSMPYQDSTELLNSLFAEQLCKVEQHLPQTSSPAGAPANLATNPANLWHDKPTTADIPNALPPQPT